MSIKESKKMNLVSRLALLSLMLTGQAWSQSTEEQSAVHPYLTDKFMLDLGVYFPERELRIRVDSPTGGPGNEIDFQSEFNDKRTDDLFALNFGWRFGENWQLGAQYFESKGFREAVLEEDVEWNDLIFGAGSGIAIGQDFTLTRIFFARDFSIEDHHEFGVGAGIHWLEFGASISGRIFDGSGGEGAFRTESARASAPLPNIGVWYVYSISPDWSFKTRFDWMSAKVGDYDGRLINASIGVNYKVFENAGVGLSYNLFDLDLGIRKSGWKGRWDTTYEGLYAYLSFFW
jgi:hypothetical protein